MNINKMKLIIWTVSFLACFELASIIGSTLMNLERPLSPLNLFRMLEGGYFVPVLVGSLLSIALLISAILWLDGGEKRVISVRLIIICLAFIVANSFAVYFFNLWENINMPAYPWLVYTFFFELNQGTSGFNHLVICLLPAYGLFILFVAVLFNRDVFSGLAKAKKVYGGAHFASAFELKKAGLFSEEGIVLGKAHGQIVRMPGFESVLVTAPTGSGKTTSIAIPNLLEWRGSVVVNDLKGELHETTARFRQDVLGNQVFCWAPADVQKRTDQYNPFFYVSDRPELQIRDLQLIAETIIPATRLGDAFWYQSSRELFMTLALYLIEHEGHATLGKLHDLAKQRDFFKWLLKLSVDTEKLSVVLEQNIAAILSADDKTRSNILKDFHSRLVLFSDPLVRHATDDNNFDLRTLRKNQQTIYLTIPEADKERLSPILTLFWAQLVQVLTAHQPTVREEPYPVLALLDEFGNMSRIDRIKSGLSFLRSYRLRCVIMVQYLSQLYSIYDQHDARAFLNTKAKLIFTQSDYEDAGFFSKAMGEKTVKTESHSISSGYGDQGGSQSKQYNYKSRALMTADGILQMKADQAIILVEGHMPVKAKKCYWFKEKRYAGLINP